MANTKQAVDSTAVEYWTSYFGDYGKTFTKDVPRRVAQVIVQGLRRAAKDNALRVVRAQVIPYGWAKTATGGLTFEGAFRGRVVRGGRENTVLRAFAAEFDPSGKVVDVQVLTA
jgi:hypothetical protein